MAVDVLLKQMRTNGYEARQMKTIRILISAIVLFISSGLSAHQDDAPGTEKSIQALISQLDGRSWDQAAKALTRIGEPAVDPLLRALNQNSQWISARASISLSKIGSEEALDGLLSALNNTSLDQRIKRYILQSLGNCKSEPVLDPLIRHLDHEDWSIRCAVLRSLGQIGGARAEAAAIDALRDRERYVVESAITVLGQMKSSRAPTHLIDILEEREGMGRIKISRALAQIGEPAVDAIVASLGQDVDCHVAWHLVWVLGRIDSDAAIAPLVQALKSRNWMVRNEAAVSLVRLNSCLSAKALRSLVASGPENARTQAQWVLKALESDHAIRAEDAWLGETGDTDRVQVPAAPAASQVSYEGGSYALCPHRFASQPSVPSPFVSEDGRDIIVTRTKDDSYMLVPVTLTNSAGKARQLQVNAHDFPMLARTGFHCEQTLDRTQIITGRSIAEITELARPNRLSTSGFVAEDEDIISVLKGDNRFARHLGLSHAQLAKPLFHLLNLTSQNQKHKNHLSYRGHRAQYPAFLYNGKTVSVQVEYTRGGQASIFADGLNGALGIQINREWEAREKDYLDRAYSHLNQQQRKDLEKKLSSLFIGEMVMYYAKCYGFYEGHTGWRADPIAIAFIFGLKDLEEINAAFDGKLYHALTAHFTRD